MIPTSKPLESVAVAYHLSPERQASARPPPAQSSQRERHQTTLLRPPTTRRTGTLDALPRPPPSSRYAHASPLRRTLRHRQPTHLTSARATATALPFALRRRSLAPSRIHPHARWHFHASNLASPRPRPSHTSLHPALRHTTPAASLRSERRRACAWPKSATVTATASSASAALADQG